jgi:glycosyltransferase involved in cell wall biosynthesis
MNPIIPVTVVINNFNYGRYLASAIDSALHQTYPRIEVIVVDDGSTDESRAVIAAYQDRVIPVLKENGGQASAFNAGFAHAQGDLLIFLDSDDILLPHVVEQVVAAF